MTRNANKDFAYMKEFPGEYAAYVGGRHVVSLFEGKSSMPRVAANALCSAINAVHLRDVRRAVDRAKRGEINDKTN